MVLRKARQVAPATGRTPPAGPASARKAAALASALAWLAAGSCAAIAAPGDAQPGTPPAAPSSPRSAFDPARVIELQMVQEKSGDMTGQLSKGFEAAYDAVPRDEENLGFTIFGGGYDVPDKIVKVSDPKYDAADPSKASVTVTLHCTNPDARKPSFDRTYVVAFVKEGGQWRIDDVRSIDAETPAQRKAGQEIWLKRGFVALADARPRPAVESVNPACVRSLQPVTDPSNPALAAGFRTLTDLGPHPRDPNRRTVEAMFVKAIGSACPFRFQLVDLNGDGLADLVLQLADRRLGATDGGLQRTAIYTLDDKGKWQPAIDGLSRSVLVRTDRSGVPEVALADSGDGYRSWRWSGTAFVPSQVAPR